MRGINNSNPTLTDGAGGARCELTGEPIFSGFTVDTSLPEAGRLHFNPAAFRMPQPNRTPFSRSTIRGPQIDGA